MPPVLPYEQPFNALVCRAWLLSVTLYACAAWMITYAIMLTIISAAVTVVCCVSFLRSSDPSLLLVLLLFFAASELAFGLLIASVFNNAKTAGIVAPLAHFACLMPRYIFFRSEAPQVQQLHGPCLSTASVSLSLPPGSPSLLTSADFFGTSNSIKEHQDLCIIHDNREPHLHGRGAWPDTSAASKLSALAWEYVLNCKHEALSMHLQAIAGKVAVSLLSPSAFTFAADLIGQYEGSGVGLQWSDMWSDPLPLGAILFMLAIDAKIYAGLAW